jgi:hypothetical protein
MTGKWQAEFESFTGHLSLGPERLPVIVRIGIDAAGALQFEFGTIKLAEKSRFVFVSWHSATREMTYFSLDAATANGTTFSTERLFFLSLNNRSDASGTWFAPTAKCDVGSLRYRLKIPAERPALRMRLKGFRNFGSLHEECSLGRVAAQGLHEIEDVDTVTGSFTIQAVADVDATLWKKDADKLLEHIRRIMSFAAASLLGSPIVEFFAGDTLEVSVRSEARQRSGTAPIIHFLAQESIFKAAVTSFFSPPVVVNHLYFAIEWFAMVATYNEVRLVNAMTALENLIDSNLSRNEALILPRNQFDKIRRVLFSIIRACVSKWAPDTAEEVLIELNEKLLDLNRRSLLRKLETLRQRWNVPLNGIDDGTLKAAKQARDKVVHRGQYYEDAKESDADLWTHVTVVREVAVRFLFTAIGFKGRYISHMGGYHDAEFPPLGPEAGS